MKLCFAYDLGSSQIYVVEVEAEQGTITLETIEKFLQIEIMEVAQKQGIIQKEKLENADISEKNEAEAKIVKEELENKNEEQINKDTFHKGILLFYLHYNLLN